MLSLKIILITTNDVKLQMQRHVLSSNLEQNDSQNEATFLNLGGNFGATLEQTFGCIALKRAFLLYVVRNKLRNG